MATDAVERRRDDWIEVPAETTEGLFLPLSLRPGADGSKVRISPTLREVELDVVKLRQGLTLIEAEQQCSA